MTKKRTLLTVLLSIAMSLLLCFGFVFQTDTTFANAATTTTVTLGTGRWATDNGDGASTVTFDGCATSTGTKVGEYTGVVYVGETERSVTLSWSGETFVVRGLNSADTLFTVYSETQFLRANGEIYQFAKNYKISYTYGTSNITIEELVLPVTVKLDTGAGSWATNNGYTTGSGNPNTVKFTGVTVENAPTAQTRYNYTYDNTILSLDVYADGTTIVFNIRGDFSELLIKKTYKFVQQGGAHELYLDKDYKIAWTYGGNITVEEYVEEPEVASTIVTLGTGRWATDLNDGTAQITFDNCTTSTGTKAGEYTGVVYVGETERNVTLSWSGETFVVKGLNSSDTSFVALAETQFLRANGDIYQFAKDYKVTYELGTSNITIADYVAPVAAEVTLGASGWHGIPATGVAQLSFENSSYSGALTTSDYTGIVYDAKDNEYEATVFWSDLSKNTIRFKVSNSITSFIVKTDSVFTTENGDTITFDRDYLCSYVAGSTTSAVEYVKLEPIAVTLSTGRYATSNSWTVSFNKATWNGSNDSFYYGTVYSLTGEEYNAKLTFNAASGADGNFIITLDNGDLTAFMIVKEVIFTSDSGKEVYFATDYRVSYSWNSSVSVEEYVVKDPAIITLGASGYHGAPSADIAQLSFTNSSIVGGSQSTTQFVGYVYDIAGGKHEATVLWADTTSGKLLIRVSSEVKSFIIKAATVFSSTLGDELKFDKNYFCSYVVGGATRSFEYVASSHAVVTIGEFRWASDLEPATENSRAQVSFNDCTIANSPATTTSYYGTIYDEDNNAYEAEIVWQTTTTQPNLIVRLTENLTVFNIEKSWAFVTGSQILSFSQGYTISYESFTDREAGTGVGGFVEIGNELLDFNMLIGGSVRLGKQDGQNGLRFSAYINKSLVADWEAQGYTVRTGVVIMPYKYIAQYGAFNVENLFENGKYYSAKGTVQSGEVQIIDLTCDMVDGDNTKDNMPEYWRLNGSITNIKLTNLQVAYIGRAYVELTDTDGSKIYHLANYYNYNEVNNKRTIMSIAQAAYDDVKTSEDDKETLWTLYLSKRITQNIVEDGEAVYSILVSENATANEVYAAEELQTLIKEASGAELEIVNVAGGNYISLGATSAFEPLGVTLSEDLIGTTGYVIKSDSDHNIYIAGMTDVGTLNGVYGYLAEMLNFEYYAVDVYDLDTATTIVARDFDITAKPTFDYRQVTYMELRENEEAYRRMRMEVAPEEYITGNSYHNTLDILEYNNTTVQSGWTSNGQLCYSNTAMRAQFIENLKLYLTDTSVCNPDLSVMVIGMEDNVNWCSCSTCAAAPSKVQAEFMNAVAQAINTERENPITFLMFAYYNTLTPPTGVTLDENVGVMFAPIKARFMAALDDGDVNKQYEAALKGWSALTDNLYAWTYNAYFAQTLVMYDTFNTMQANYQFFAENGVKGLYDQTESYMNRSSGYGRLKAYLQSKLQWNVNVDVNALIDKFFDKFYGGVGYTMQTMFEETREYYAELYAEEGFASQNTISEASTSKVSETSRQFANFDCLDAGFWGIGRGSKYNEFKGKLESWITTLNELMTANASDTELVDRIKLESLQYRYLYIDIYGETSSITKSAFKEDMAHFGIEYYKEGQLVSDLWS